MAKFEIGDLVVLKSGSMRMTVEEIDDESVATVWCNEGVIGRDRFAVALINKWEHREDSGGFKSREGGGGYKGNRDRDDRGGGGGSGGGGGGYKGNRDRDDRGGGGYKGTRDRDDKGTGGGYKGSRGGDDDRPARPKTGWDGKPRDKKYFRKDD